MLQIGAALMRAPAPSRLTRGVGGTDAGMGCDDGRADGQEDFGPVIDPDPAAAQACPNMTDQACADTGSALVVDGDAADGDGARCRHGAHDPLGATALNVGLGGGTECDGGNKRKNSDGEMQFHVSLSSLTS